MKRAERVAAIIKILSETPNKSYSLNYFCNLFGAAKSSISEDLQTAKQTLESVNLGIIQTTSGAGGGVKYIPYISDQDCKKLQEETQRRQQNFRRRFFVYFRYYVQFQSGQTGSHCFCKKISGL